MVTYLVWPVQGGHDTEKTTAAATTNTNNPRQRRLMTLVLVALTLFLPELLHPYRQAHPILRRSLLGVYATDKQHTVVSAVGDVADDNTSKRPPPLLDRACGPSKPGKGT